MNFAKTASSHYDHLVGESILRRISEKNREKKSPSKKLQPFARRQNLENLALGSNFKRFQNIANCTKTLLHLRYTYKQYLTYFCLCLSHLGWIGQVENFSPLSPHYCAAFQRHATEMLSEKKLLLLMCRVTLSVIASFVRASLSLHSCSAQGESEQKFFYIVHHMSGGSASHVRKKRSQTKLLFTLSKVTLSDTTFL